MKKMFLAVAMAGLAATAVSAGAAPAPDSKRLAMAKDYIADEQWVRAIRELRAVSADASDPNRDEALFWLAHSEHQVGDQAGSLETIAELERLFPRSRWVRPARSLRVEIAQRLQRDDVLWVLAAPPAPTAINVTPRPGTPPAQPVPGMGPTPTPPPAAIAPPALPRARGAAPPQPTPTVPVTVTSSPAPAPLPPGGPMAPPALAPGVPIGRMRLMPPAQAMPGLLPAEPYRFDSDLQIEALVSLLDSHSDRVIPLLREIALDTKNPSEARRAVFALAQSNRPEARNTVLEAAKHGPGIVRIAAIRELGRFPESTFTTSLVNIARAEPDAAVRDTAIVTLGRSGARPQLRTLYSQLPPSSRFAVVTALFNAKDDDELIRIATNERDQRLRTHARQQLRLLATPKAVKFLTENP